MEELSSGRWSELPEATRPGSSRPGFQSCPLPLPDHGPRSPHCRMRWHSTHHLQQLGRPEEQLMPRPGHAWYREHTCCSSDGATMALSICSVSKLDLPAGHFDHFGHSHTERRLSCPRHLLGLMGPHPKASPPLPCSQPTTPGSPWCEHSFDCNACLYLETPTHPPKPHFTAPLPPPGGA